MDIESQRLVEHPNHKRHEFLRWIPVIGLAVSFYSALFATFILYPWHIELSKEFADMKNTCIKN
jgi:hypothetical protein